MILNNLIIKNLLHQKSNSTILIPEYSKELIAQAAVSLLNTQNGDILVGVMKDRRVIGIADVEQKRQEIQNYLQERIVPNPPLTVTVCNYDKKGILLISVWEGAQKPYSYKKNIYVKLSDSIIKASVSDLLNLIRERKNSEFTWERRPVLAASLQDLDRKEMDATKKETTYNNRDTEEFLQYMNLLSNDVPTNACITLFAIEPAKYIPQIRIKLSCFEGKSKVEGIKFMQEFEGNIFNNIVNVFHAIDVVYPKRQRISNWKRDEQYTYPHLAVREGVVNAIVHRDYTDNNQININIYADKLEIINPGTFPDGITVDSLSKPHQSVVRNPDIAHCCLIRKYAEIMGSGTLRMISECQRLGFEIPQWDAKNNFISVVFNNLYYNRIDNEGINEGVNKGNDFEGVIDGIEGITDETQRTLLNIVESFKGQNGVKLKELVLRTNRPAKTVERYLKILKDLSIIEFRGSPRNGKYYLTKSEENEQ